MSLLRVCLNPRLTRLVFDQAACRLTFIDLGELTLLNNGSQTPRDVALFGNLLAPSIGKETTRKLALINESGVTFLCFGKYAGNIQYGWYGLTLLRLRGDTGENAM
jgi:hypothetical protein